MLIHILPEVLTYSDLEDSYVEFVEFHNEEPRYGFVSPKTFHDLHLMFPFYTSGQINKMPEFYGMVFSNSILIRHSDMDDGLIVWSLADEPNYLPNVVQESGQDGMW